MKNMVDIITYRLVPEKRPVYCRNRLIYGPIISKRSYHSLGINLWPLGKFCSFKCVYCHCGDARKFEDLIYSLEKAKKDIRQGFRFHAKHNKHIQDILVEGNGEPTLYPYFAEVVDYVIKMRDKYFPNIPIVLFTNCTNLGNQKVVDAILRFNQAFFKIDAADQETFETVDGTRSNFDNIIKDIEKVGQLIETNNYALKNFEVSTAVVGSKLGNYDSLNSEAYTNIIRKLNPQKVYLYDIDRVAPGARHDFRINLGKLKKLAEYLFKKTNIEVISLYSGKGRGNHELANLNKAEVSEMESSHNLFFNSQVMDKSVNA